MWKIDQGKVAPQVSGPQNWSRPPDKIHRGILKGLFKVLLNKQMSCMGLCPVLFIKIWRRFNEETVTTCKTRGMLHNLNFSDEKFNVHNSTSMSKIIKFSLKLVR